MPVNTYVEPEHHAAGIEVFIHGDEAPSLRHREPALFFRATQKLFEEPTSFLKHHYVKSGRRSSPNTWAIAAHALAGWFEFLFEKGIYDWALANLDDLSDYRTAYELAISPRTGRRYASGTISNRMSAIITFYRIAEGRGWIDGSFFSPVARPTAPSATNSNVESLGRGRFRTTAHDLVPSRRKSKETVRPFMASELRIFLPQLGPRMLERSEGDERPSRDRIIGDIGVFVGLRVDEVYSLSKYQFLALTPPADGPVGDQQVLVKGKGGKTRPVAFPNWLVLDIQAYISTERAKAVDDGGLTGRNDPAALLVSGSQAKAPGRGLSRRRLQQIVELACIRAGLVQRRSWRDPETGESFVRETAKHCFHDLRHTYAVLTYWAEKAGGNSEPWKKIQAQLGHEHLKTTIDTYLSFVEIFGDRESLLDVRRLIGLTG